MRASLLLLRFLLPLLFLCIGGCRSAHARVVALESHPGPSGQPELGVVCDTWGLAAPSSRGHDYRVVVQWNSLQGDGRLVATEGAVQPERVVARIESWATGPAKGGVKSAALAKATILLDHKRRLHEVTLPAPVEFVNAPPGEPPPAEAAKSGPSAEPSGAEDRSAPATAAPAAPTIEPRPTVPTCGYCGKAVESGKGDCPHCGASLR